MILGCDAAGVDQDGNEVIVHAVVSDPRWRGDETLDPRRSLLSERHQGTLAQRVMAPRSNLVAEAPGAQLRAGRMPAHGVAHLLPDAVHPRPADARGRRSSSRAPAAASRPR